MLLSRAQLEYIDQRRDELNAEELQIRRVPESIRYGNEVGDNYTARLMVMTNERHFYNNMIRLHNVEKRAQKQAQKDLENEVERVLKDDQ